MSTEIKQNLFRFVTLRNPQLIEKKENEDYKGFVFHPELDSPTPLSKFLDAIKEVSKEEERVAAIKNVAESFSPLKNRVEVKSLNTGFYQFSHWLTRNKNVLSYTDISKNTENLSVLKPEEEIVLWDNLVYQTINKSSVYVREALIQMLIANKFLNAFLKFSEGISEEITFTEDQAQEFTRRANASVVMPQNLILTSSSIKSSNSKQLSKNQLSTISDTLEVDLAKARIDAYKQLKKELRPIEEAYTKANKKTYKEALDKYNSDVQKLYDEATPVIVEETDPKTGKTFSAKTYPDLVIPDFSFVREEAITEAYMTGKLEESSLELFKSEELDAYDEFSEVIKAINEKTKKESEVIFAKTSKLPKAIKIGGSVLRTEQPPSPYDYNIPNIMELMPSGLARPLMLLLNGLQTSQISNVECTIDFNNGDSFTQQGFVTVGTSLTTMKLFPMGVSFPVNTDTYTLTGSITLVSGEELTFVQVVDTKTRYNLGNFNSTGDSSTTSEIQGVTRLGIGDFRRVEQEVCCYVPGEVSHIENVMKGEFKERKNKILKRSENTFTTENERTTEQLRDTTSTDRHEIEQETSQIILEDSAFDLGVTLTTSGPNTSLGVNSNYATINSSEQSDFQAVSYAKEVTERALERIVDRVREERITKIIEEFQEENTHSLDNVSGSDHLAGLYRWVDKVYKNRVVNYGKRLMYEFNIPEPAAYYIKQKANENNIDDSSLEVPVDPRAQLLPDETPNLNRVATHLDIDDSNYAFWAGKYNVSITPPPMGEMAVTKSFKEEPQSQSWKSFIHQNIQIPENYYCNKGKIRLVTSHEGGNNLLKFKFQIGEDKFSFSTTTINDGMHRNFYLDNKFENELSVSIVEYDAGAYAFNIILECNLKEEAFEQWQLETFNKIVTAYEAKKAQYDSALKELGQSSNSLFSINGSNPLYYRQIEQTELKKNCIYLMKDHLSIGKDFVNELTNDEMVPQNNEAFGNYAALTSFMEQAFDWKLMTYLFYPYFWADKNKWSDLFGLEDNDNVFQAFLKSGMARVVVPVRPGFEKAIMNFFETGEIWDGGELPVLDDELYLSIDEELQEQQGVVEGDPWETRVPTALTVLQAQNGAIEGNGLPCYCEDHEASGVVVAT